MSSATREQWLPDWFWEEPQEPPSLIQASTGAPSFGAPSVIPNFPAPAVQSLPPFKDLLSPSPAIRAGTSIHTALQTALAAIDFKTAEEAVLSQTKPLPYLSGLADGYTRRRQMKDLYNSQDPTPEVQTLLEYTTSDVEAVLTLHAKLGAKKPEGEPKL